MQLIGGSGGQGLQIFGGGQGGQGGCSHGGQYVGWQHCTGGSSGGSGFNCVEHGGSQLIKSRYRNCLILE